MKKHKIIIHSLYDAQASCSCGWNYCFTGERTKKEVQKEYLKHLSK